MSFSICRFIKRVAERVPKEHTNKIPADTRGIYALLNEDKNSFNVVYVGMSDSGIRSRLGNHRRAKWLKSHWTHFTLFEVHDNITEDEIKELEGLIRHIYRKDTQANKHNTQLCHKPFQNRSIQVPKKSFNKKGWSK